MSHPTILRPSFFLLLLRVRLATLDEGLRVASAVVGIVDIVILCPRYFCTVICDGSLAMISGLPL